MFVHIPEHQGAVALACIAEQFRCEGSHLAVDPDRKRSQGFGQRIAVVHTAGVCDGIERAHELTHLNFCAMRFDQGHKRLVEFPDFAIDVVTGKRGGGMHAFDLFDVECQPTDAVRGIEMEQTLRLISDSLVSTVIT